MTNLKTEDLLIKNKLMLYLKNKDINVYEIESSEKSIVGTINEILSRNLPLNSKETLNKNDSFEFKMNKIGLYFSESGKLIDGEQLCEDMSFTFYITSHMMKPRERYHHLNLDELSSEKIVFKIFSNKYDKINSMMSLRYYFIIKVKKLILNAIKSLRKKLR